MLNVVEMVVLDVVFVDENTLEMDRMTFCFTANVETWVEEEMVAFWIISSTTAWVEEEMDVLTFCISSGRDTTDGPACMHIMRGFLHFSCLASGWRGENIDLQQFEKLQPMQVDEDQLIGSAQELLVPLPMEKLSELNLAVFELASLTSPSEGTAMRTMFGA